MTSQNTIVHAGITRKPAPQVIFPNTKVVTPEISKLRVAWARLMDTGEIEEAEALENEIRCADTFELAIANGLAELVLIERRAQEKRAQAQAQRVAPVAKPAVAAKPGSRSVSGRPSDARFDYTARRRIPVR